MKAIGICGVLLIGAGLLSAQDDSKTVSFIDFRGRQVGTAILTQLGENAMEIKLAVKDLPPGLHAVHFHENAKCEPPTFESAGAHFNPAGKQHGSQNEAGPHAGDLYNFRVADDGTSNSTIITQKAVLSSKRKAPSVLAGKGTALVIHQDWDDLKTDPTGNSGARLACALVK